MKQSGSMLISVFVWLFSVLAIVQASTKSCQYLRGDETKILEDNPDLLKVWFGTSMHIVCCTRSKDAAWYDPHDKPLLNYFSDSDKANRLGMYFLPHRDMYSKNIMVLYLMVNNFTKAMNGVYKCGVSPTKASQIKVVGRPRVLIDAEKIQVLEEGKEGRIKCQPRGNGMRAFHTAWYFKDKFLQPGNDHRISFLQNHTILRITSVNASLDAGMYLCKANVIDDGTPRHREGSYVEVEPIKVIVFVAPFITPDSIVVKSAAANSMRVAAVEDSSLELACDTTGLPPPEIEWYMDGRRLRDNSKEDGGRVTIKESYYRRHGYSNLKIEPVHTWDVGKYKCVSKVRVNNQTVAETSKSITPEFAFITRFIDKLCNLNKVTPRNRNILLNCTVTGAYHDKLLTSFVKNSFSGKVMYFNESMEHSRFKFTTFPDYFNPYITHMTLTIYDVDTSDSGFYYCRARLRLNLSASMNIRPKYGKFHTSDPGVLHVMAGPKISERQSVQYGLNHGINNVECRAQGYPEMEWRWTYRDYPITRRMQQYDMDNSYENETSISILRVRSSYTQKGVFGEYRCYARNALGNDSFKIIMLQASRPDAQEVKVCKIDATRIKLCISPGSKSGGLPLMHFELRMMKSGQSGYMPPRFYSATSRTITLAQLKPDTTYKLALCAASRAGRGRNTYIEVTTSPVSAPVIELVNTSGSPDWNSFNLRWKIESDGGLPIVQYNVQIQEVKIDSWGNVVERIEPPKTMVINTLSEIKKYFRVNSLKPKTWYELKFNARNLIGQSTLQQVVFQTLDPPSSLAKSMRLLAAEKAATSLFAATGRGTLYGGMLIITGIQLLMKMHH